VHREIHLRDLWAVVRRHWRVLALIAVLVAIGAWWSARKSVPQYQSHLTVQIGSPKQVLASLDPGTKVDEMALKTDPVRSEALVLTTQGLALRVVNALGLELEFDDPTIARGRYITNVQVDSTPPSGRYALVLRGASGWSLRNAADSVLAFGPYATPAAGPGFQFRVRPSSANATLAFHVSSPEEAAAWVSGGLTYSVRQGTNAVDIYYTGTDATLVPGTLNEAALQLRLGGIQRARTIAERRRTYISEQLDKARVAYQERLDDLQQFKEHQAISDLPAEQQALVNSMQLFEQQRQQLLVQRELFQQALDRDTSTIGVEALNRLSAVENVSANTALDFQIQTLLKLYENRRTLTAGTLGLRTGNPQVRAIDQRIVESTQALREAVQASLSSIDLQLKATQKKIDDIRAQLQSFPGMQSRIAQLELEADIQQQTEKYLLGQYESARLEEATITPYISILDGASPAYAVGTTVRQKVILGLLVGLLLGLGGAFFLEYLDQTIKSSHDVERVLGVPVLGLIPFDAKFGVQGNGTRVPVALVTAGASDDPAAEAFRTLRTNVTFVGAEKPIQVIAVSSPGPGEGKSTTACNLAVTLAQNGHRTILIDGDLRRPLVHRAFGLLQEPGLTDILVGRAHAKEAVRPEVMSNLDVLPSGSTPPNPSELLGSDAMHSLLGEFRREYEYILIDTPPVLPVTDATVVASVADATILTVRSGDTEEAAAQRALDQLRRVDARIAGAVLNGVNRTRDQYYTYYSYSKRPQERGRRPAKSLRSKIADWF